MVYVDNIVRKTPVSFILLFLLPALWAVPDSQEKQDEIIEILQGGGISYEKRSLEVYGGSGDTLLAILPGPDAAELSPEVFILAVPLSVRQEKPGEFSYGVSTALAFIRKMKEQGAARRVIAAFLDDEDRDYRGIVDFASFLDYPENAALVYLELPSPPRGLLIRHGVRGNVAPLALVRPLPGLLNSRGIPCSFGARSHEHYKLGLAGGPPALETAQGQEISAILLNGMAGLPDAAPVGAEVLAELLVEYSGAVQWRIGGMDTHYSLFDYGKRIFFLSERSTVLQIFFLAGIGIILWLWRYVLHHSHNPGPAHSGAAVKGRPAPTWADHTGHAAVMVSILGVLGGTLMDLSCAPAFIWGLIFAILGAALPFFPAVFVCALLSVFKGAETLVQTLRVSPFSEIRPFIQPGIYLILALLVLPFLLLILRGIFLIGEWKNGRISPLELEKSGL
jgi:hypothetical protein